jgi:glycosyltransferase involved in cell wall biosynthesis
MSHQALMVRVNLLIHVHTVGLRRDLRVFQDVLRTRDVELTVTAFDPAFGPRLRRGVRRAVNAALPWKRYDINVFVEEIGEHWLPFARVNCLMPHQEWLSDRSRALLPRIDAVLCKTHFAQTVFTALGSRTIFTGFTTLDRFDPSVAKNFGSCLHLAGSSLQKGSVAVNHAWLKNPSFPTLELFWYEPAARPVPAPNVRVHREFATEEMVNQTENRCGIHLCPSEAEGFGHYLVEAMSCGAVVVTTDAPPMNELVQEGRGVLVGYGRSAPQAAGTNFYVDEGKLAQAMSAIFAMPLEQRKAMGDAARMWFLENDRTFRDRFWEVLQGLV